MNIDFKYLKLKNFLSFGNKETTYQFEENKIVNVKGRNLDIEIGKENGSSNGSGKSACYQAIVYAIYGNGINDIKQDEFINLTNGKDMMVELALESDGKKLRIVRTRKPNSVQLFVDGEDWTRDSISNTNASIEQLIGVNYDTFVLSFLMTTAVQPLLSRKPSEQRNFMEDLLGMNTLTERANQVKKIRDDAQIELRLVEKDIENADEFNQREQAVFDSNKEKFEKYIKDKALRLELLENKAETEKSILSKEDEIRKIFSDLDQADSFSEDIRAKLSDLKSSISEKKTEIPNIKLKISELSSSSDTIKSKLEDEEYGLKKSQENHKKASLDLSNLESEVSVVEEATDLIESISKLEKEKETLTKTVREYEAKLEKVSDELNQLQDESCPYCKQHWSNDELKSKIEVLNRNRIEVIDVIDQAGLDLHNINEAISTDKTSLSGYSDKYIKEAEVILDKYDDKKTEVRRLDSDISRHTENIRRFKDSLKEAEASQSEIPTLEGNMASCEKELKKLEGTLGGAEKAATEALESVTEIRAKVSDTGFNTVVEFERKINEIKNIGKEIENLKSEENPYDDPSEKPPKLRDVEELKGKQDKFNEEIKHCKYLIKLLTDSKSFIRRNIIGRYVPYLNRMINTYADKLDSPHICEIENDLSVKIEYMRKSVSYHSLSAGERLKLDVGVSMALRDLMAMIGVKSGFLMVDELFDSALDTQSKRNVFKLIKDRFDSVMLVSHSGEFDDKCDSKITIIKENGFSRLEI